MKLFALVTAAAVLSAVSAAGNTQTVTSFKDDFIGPLGPDYEKLGAEWQVATWRNGWPFACTFSTARVALKSSGDISENGLGLLDLSFDGIATWEDDTDDTCAEARTKKSFQYGTFYVSMQPTEVIGTVSSFFLYTGRSRTRSHQEIDFEFVPGSLAQNPNVIPGKTHDGKVPKWHVYTNYWINGKENPAWIDLEMFPDPHNVGERLNINPFSGQYEYAFIWAPKSISWWINAGTRASKRWIKLREVNAAISAKMPLMMNVWTGVHDNGWTGQFRTSLVRTGSAQYEYVQVKPVQAAP